MQCNIEKLFHFFFTSVVCVDKPTDLSVCLSSYPSPFFRRKLSTNKTGKLFFFLFFYILFVVFLMKYNFGKKSLKMQNTKKKIAKKYLKKVTQSYHTSHNTKLKGTWEESYFAGTCTSAKMHMLKCLCSDETCLSVCISTSYERSPFLQLRDPFLQLDKGVERRVRIHWRRPISRHSG